MKSATSAPGYGRYFAGAIRGNIGTMQAETSTAFGALREDETRRSRDFLITELITVLPMTVLAQVTPGNTSVRPWLVAASVVCSVTFIGAIVGRLRSPMQLVIVNLPVIPFMILAYMFMGVWSFIAASSAVGIFVFAMGSSAWLARLCYLLCASIPAVGMLGLATGRIHPTGLVHAPAISPALQVAFAIYAQLYLGVMYWQGRATRQSQVVAMQELESALRRVAARDALLGEAERDLDRMRGGLGEGRWSGTRVGNWLLGHVLGRGAMGEVYDATHGETRQPAAVKVLSVDPLESPEVAARFHREITILSRLHHPAIVELHDFGDENGVPFLVMEKLSGEPLSSVLRRARRLQPAEVRQLVEEVTGGLDVAHAAGVVHRDLKPQNLFRLGDARWKILDFGISKLAEAATLTREVALGTPGYMSPEQARAGVVDQRADIFSLGLVAYRCLTGVPAFTGDNLQLLHEVVHSQPMRPSSHVELPGDVELVLAIALAKSPDDRFASATEFGRALAAAFEGRLEDRWRSHADALLRALPWRRLDVEDTRTEPFRRAT